MLRFLSLFSNFLVVLSFSSLSAASLQSLETSWGLSSLQTTIQHPLEGLKLRDLKGSEKKELEVSTWYEDLSITQASPPDQRLFCRFMHNFLYGRAKLRQSSSQMPPQTAFSEMKELEKIRFNYIAVLYRNKPYPPSWTNKPEPPPMAIDPKAQLRVLWTREEKVIPYLSLEVTRNEWSNAMRYFAKKPYYSFSEFRNEACTEAYRLMPSVKSNFAGLSDALQKNSNSKN